MDDKIKIKGDKGTKGRKDKLLEEELIHSQTAS